MRLLTITLILAAILVPSAIAQGRPDPAAHKAAMQKLKFLTGTWFGEAIVAYGPDKQMAIQQTEEVQYKLDGLLMQIEGTGRDAGGKVVFNAFAVVSFDPKTSTYRMRAWNAGNFADAELKVTENGFEWGFDQGPLTMLSSMTLDSQGRWSETSDATVSGRKMHSTKMLLSRKR